jgi:hypothetical protein
MLPACKRCNRSELLILFGVCGSDEQRSDVGCHLNGCVVIVKIIGFGSGKCGDFEIEDLLCYCDCRYC